LARIGVVVPMSNTNLEPDMVLLRLEGVSLHFARAGGYDIDKIPDAEQMGKFALASLDDVIASLMAALPDIILYGCTSATLSHGPAFDREFQVSIEKLSARPAVTAAGALVEALIDLKVKRVGFCSPYTRELNDTAARFLELSGFDVVSRKYVGEDLGNYGQGQLSPEQVFDLGKGADRADAEAIVLSCTDMRAVEAISALENTLQKPVVTSNQALMYSALKRLDLTRSYLPGALNKVH
jgi:maleate cis-trans isomerase